MVLLAFSLVAIDRYIFITRINTRIIIGTLLQPNHIWTRIDRRKSAYNLTLVLFFFALLQLLQ